MTINEPQCIAQLGYGTSNHAPGWKLPEEEGGSGLPQPFLAPTALPSEPSRGMRQGETPCGRGAMREPCISREDTPEGREAAYRASFDLKVGWSFNVFLDSLILHHYDDSASDAFISASPPPLIPGTGMMETPDYLGLNIYQGFMVNRQGEEVKRNPGFP